MVEIIFLVCTMSVSPEMGPTQYALDCASKPGRVEIVVTDDGVNFRLSKELMDALAIEMRKEFFLKKSNMEVVDRE